jgi:hypothetical protein
MGNCINFSSPGVLLTKLSDEQLAPIWAEVRAIQADYSKGVLLKNYLAGNIRKEFQLFDCKQHTQDMLQPYIGEYIHTFKYASRLQQLTTNVPMVLAEQDLWVNFQEQGEFNPPHDHSGVFSFVIWLQIPYTLEEEYKNGPGAMSNEPINGEFSFTYPDITGRTQIARMGADRTKEGYLCLFPHMLFHSVAPFYTTDQTRISVSGNLKFKVD